jgi:hypothetical protein
MIFILPPNTQVKPTRVAEQTAWQAVPAMLFVERHEFGLNVLLGRGSLFFLNLSEIDKAGRRHEAANALGLDI